MPEATAAVETPETPAIEAAPDDTAKQNGTTPETVKATESTESTPAEKTARELELEAELEAERSKKDKAYKDARKAADSRRNVQKDAGKWEELYNETESTLATVTTERDTLQANFDAQTAKLKAAQKELDAYRKSVVERFESDDDKALAESTPLDKLPALYERLYARPIMQPPPSVGASKVTTRAVETPAQTLEEYNRKKYGTG